MRKHIYGIALFLFIVSSGAVFYKIFLAPRAHINIPSTYCQRRIPAAVTQDPDPIQKDHKPGPLSYKLKSFYIDLETGDRTVEIQLDWNSSENPRPVCGSISA